jgi:transcriptional regulator with XRE-family HTH domain
VQKSARHKLASFLRAKRTSTSPESYGLATDGVRRTPGLRREEVANLAGVSSSWYAYLEQAREVSPSEHTLAGVARALRLSPAEREYIRTLVSGHFRGARELTEAPEVLRRIVEQSCAAAYVKSPRWEVLAANERAEELFRFGGSGVHYIRWLFGTYARSLIAGWEEFVRLNLRLFRADIGPHRREAWAEALTAELSREHVEFCSWWRNHTVEERPPTSLTLDHPERGRLALTWVALADAAGSNCRVLFFEPADRASRRALRAGPLGSCP